MALDDTIPAEQADERRAAELARFYDLDSIDLLDDLPLYLELAAREEGPIMELAAGSGRIAVPLALAGHDVTGTDIDPTMLAPRRSHLDRARTMAQAARCRSARATCAHTGAIGRSVSSS